MTMIQFATIELSAELLCRLILATTPGSLRIQASLPAARRCNLLRSKNIPRAITATTRLELPMAIKGLPWTSSRSATFPASMVPIESSIAKKIAGLRVAACKACNGVKPTATNRSSSSWRHQPGWAPLLSKNALQSVPASIRMCSARIWLPISLKPAKICFH
jgi:hypothetical protein